MSDQWQMSRKCPGLLLVNLYNTLKILLLIGPLLQEIEAKELKLQQEKQEYTADIILQSQFNKSKVKISPSSLPVLSNYLLL